MKKILLQQCHNWDSNLRRPAQHDNNNGQVVSCSTHEVTEAVCYHDFSEFKWISFAAAYSHYSVCAKRVHLSPKIFALSFSINMKRGCTVCVRT